MLLTIIGFLLGVHLTISLFGAGYRLIDLRFALSQFWLNVTSRIAFYLTVIVLIYQYTSGDFTSGFFYGQVFFTIFHIGVFWLGQIMVTLLNTRR